MIQGTQAGRFEDRVVWVTGASSGIGAAAARRLAAEGATLVLSGRNVARLEAVVAACAALGADAQAVPCDVDDPQHAERVVAHSLEAHGRIDAAFLNAGAMSALGPIASLTLAAWDASLRTNLTSAFLAARALLPGFRAQGRGAVVFTSTYVGDTAALPGMAAYTAAKAGLAALARTLAAEGATDGIRANVLVPGGVDTPMGAPFVATPEARAAIEGLHALGRLGTPDELAGAAAFLLSDDASFVTGTTLYVDGGASIHRSLG